MRPSRPTGFWGILGGLGVWVYLGFWGFEDFEGFEGLRLQWLGFEGCRFLTYSLENREGPTEFLKHNTSKQATH